MERLTERTGEGQAIPRMDLRNNGHQRCMERLAEYEDTGLAPEEIMAGKLSAGWIPAEERLPEQDGFYLAVLDGEIAGENKPFVGMAEFEKGKWIDDEEDYQCIIAWMPLPEPYRPEELSKTGDCFTPEEDNPYPLCVGRNLEKCRDCQLRAEWEPEDPYGVE